MTIDTTPTSTRKPPLPGHIMYSDPRRVNCEHRIRAGVAQIATSNLTGAFNGARDLGIVYDGLIANGENAANVGAWLVLVNALLVGKAVVTHNAGVVTVTTSDFLAHTLAPYNPDTGSLDLSAFTITTEAVAAPQTFAGMGVVWKDRALRTVQAPLPDSVLADYVGLVDRMKIMPRDQTMYFNSAATSTTADMLVHGGPAIAHRYCTGYVKVATGVVVAAADPVYLGRLPAEAGYYYGADDGGNTRLLIVGAQFMVGGTGTAESAGFQVYFA